MFKSLILAALFAVSFAAAAYAEVEDFSFDIEQILNVGR